VGPKAGLEAVAKRKKSLPLPGIEPGRLAQSLVTTLNEVSPLPGSQ
jgi:hypothetical protein